MIEVTRIVRVTLYFVRVTLYFVHIRIMVVHIRMMVRLALTSKQSFIASLTVV